MSKPTHLIIVCGHAIWLGGPQNGHSEAEWLIESYKTGETPTFIAHIRVGVELLAADPLAVLAFSGGPTRPETRLSEARSYFNLAVANGMFGLFPLDDLESLKEGKRILLEERALDSYYNVLFSVLDFWRAHGEWPGMVTVVSHGFKRRRIVEGHCMAIGLEGGRAGRVRFVGVNPPGMDIGGGDREGKGEEGKGEEGRGEEGKGGEGKGEKEKGGEGKGGMKKEAMKGVQLALGQWEEDLHGVGEELAGKRRARNCWGVDQRLFFTEEERERSGVVTVLLEDGSEALTGEGIVHFRKK